MDAKPKNFFQRESDKSKQMAVIGLGIFIYLIVLFLTAGHNLQLIKRGITDDFLIFSYIGVVALELNAVAMPLALHFWAFSLSHRRAVIVFYGIDLLILIMNTAANFNLNIAANSGADIPAFAQVYLMAVAGISPLICIIFWAVLFVLDPRSEHKAKEQRIVSETRLNLTDQVATAYESPEVQSAIKQAAVKNVAALVANVLAQNQIILNTVPENAPIIPEIQYEDSGTVELPTRKPVAVPEKSSNGNHPKV